MAWFHRVAGIFRRARLRDEIAEELSYHIEARTSDNLAGGVDPAEARRDALRRFGGGGVALETAHDADSFAWLETILQDLRYGLQQPACKSGYHGRGAALAGAGDWGKYRNFQHRERGAAAHASLQRTESHRHALDHEHGEWSA